MNGTIPTNSDEHLLTEKFKSKVLHGVDSNKTVIFITYVLGELGEAKLKFIIKTILLKYNRIDLMDLLYTCAKELIVNSTKAAIKRLTFKEMGIDPSDDSEYDKFMSSFKDNLTDKKFPHYRSKMKANGFFIKIKLFYNKDKIVMRIINNFPLLKKEEARIREKFMNAKKYDNLFEFYIEHGDNTEGAGMGITMVEILLAQSGFDRHLFTIFSSKVKQETVAKVELPMHPDYVPMRYGFNGKE
ncbi:MAG TPA: hypothetical protein PLP72_02080 [Leptospiraceae bacterium]|nr:hypothetical protein [Leptospiraceae bacterium]